MSCSTSSDVEVLPPTHDTDGTDNPIPNPGAGICGTSTGVIRVTQCAPISVRLSVRRATGDLFTDTEPAGSSSSEPYTVKFFVPDAVSSPPVVEVEAESFDEGKAVVHIPAIDSPGLYQASLTVYDGDVPVISTSYWVEVSGALDFTNHCIPLSIAEIRMELRDQCAAQNALFDKLVFSDDQIAWAIRKPVDEFNATGQPQTMYTPATFPGPWRAPWSSAACGYLLRVISIGDDRDGLKYQAGGVSIDENDISYVAKLAEKMIGEWRDWMRIKKVEINVSQAWGSMGSDYSTGVWH